MFDTYNYSGTKCPKCGSTAFEMKEDQPANARYKWNYIRCSSCLCFLQAVPRKDVNLEIDEIKEMIKKLEKKVNY